MEENNHGSQYSPTVACMYVNEMNLSLPWKLEALYYVYEYMFISTFVWVFIFFFWDDPLCERGGKSIPR
jgi:hypothetical protein